MGAKGFVHEKALGSTLILGSRRQSEFEKGSKIAENPERNRTLKDRPWERGLMTEGTDGKEIVRKSGDCMKEDCSKRTRREGGVRGEIGRTYWGGVIDFIQKERGGYK